MGVRAEERGAVKYMKRAIVLLLTLALCGLTTGCAEDVPTGPGASEFEKERQALNNNKGNKGKNGKKGKRGKGKNKASKKKGGTGYAMAEQDYFYDPRGKRDPFRSIRFVDNDNPDDSEKKDFGPLGDFELGQLELSAVIWDANNPRALILDPGGRAYIVREGTAIGKNNGQVIHIGDNLVLVKETYENFAGEQTTKDVELRIRLSQGG